MKHLYSSFFLSCLVASPSFSQEIVGYDFSTVSGDYRTARNGNSSTVSTYDQVKGSVRLASNDFLEFDLGVGQTRNNRGRQTENYYLDAIFRILPIFDVIGFYENHRSFSPTRRDITVTGIGADLGLGALNFKVDTYEVTSTESALNSVGTFYNAQASLTTLIGLEIGVFSSPYTTTSREYDEYGVFFNYGLNGLGIPLNVAFQTGRAEETIGGQKTTHEFSRLNFSVAVGRSTRFTKSSTSRSAFVNSRLGID